MKKLVFSLALVVMAAGASSLLHGCGKNNPAAATPAKFTIVGAGI